MPVEIPYVDAVVASAAGEKMLAATVLSWPWSRQGAGVAIVMLQSTVSGPGVEGLVQFRALGVAMTWTETVMPAETVAPLLNASWTWWFRASVAPLSIGMLVSLVLSAGSAPR